MGRRHLDGRRRHGGAALTIAARIASMWRLAVGPVTCPECSGEGGSVDGHFQPEWNDCIVCGGEGRVSRFRLLQHRWWRWRLDRAIDWEMEILPRLRRGWYRRAIRRAEAEVANAALQVMAGAYQRGNPDWAREYLEDAVIDWLRIVEPENTLIAAHPRRLSERRRLAQCRAIARRRPAPVKTTRSLNRLPGGPAMSTTQPDAGAARCSDTAAPDRTLSVDEFDITLSAAEAKALEDADIVYACGHGHDLHLMPDGPAHGGWSHDDVEALIKGIARSAQAAAATEQAEAGASPDASAQND